MPSPRDDILKLAAQDRRFMDRLDAQMTREISKGYAAARRELVGLITERRNALYTGTFTGDKATRLRELARDVGLLQQIEARMKALSEQVAGTAQGAWRDAMAQGQGVSAEELEILLHGLGDDLTLGLGAGSVEFSLQAIDFLSVEIGLEESLKALTQSQAQTAAVLRAELRQGLLRGDSFDDLVRRLLAANGSVFARGRLSAMLGARRNVIAANNGARQVVYDYWGNRIPGLSKQACAAIDENTTDCCLRVHGQVQPVSKPYILTGTPRFADKMMYPGFHWNCRTSSVTYHAAFERGARVTTADMTGAAAAELKARRDGREEIHPAHATSRRG